MSEEYYILIDNQQTGPYTLQQVGAMLAAGTVSAASLYSTQGAEWQPLSTLGLQPPAVPPPVPSVQPPPYAPGAPGIEPVATQTSGLAIWSLVLGVLSFVLSIFTAIPAVICGHLSLGRIRQSRGALTGRGMAIAGLIIGYFFCLSPILAIPAFVSVRTRALEAKSANQERQIGIECITYASDNNGKFPPSLDALVPAYLKDHSLFASPLNPTEPDGYAYTPGLKDSDSPDTVLLEDKFASLKHVRIVLYVNCVTRIIRIP